jgi:hypothetical protein
MAITATLVPLNTVVPNGSSTTLRAVISNSGAEDTLVSLTPRPNSTSVRWGDDVVANASDKTVPGSGSLTLNFDAVFRADIGPGQQGLPVSFSAVVGTSTGGKVAISNSPSVVVYNPATLATLGTNPPRGLRFDSNLASGHLLWL